jgi:hypothetical protein
MVTRIFVVTASVRSEGGTALRKVEAGEKEGLPAHARGRKWPIVWSGKRGRVTENKI